MNVTTYDNCNTNTPDAFLGSLTGPPSVCFGNNSNIFNTVVVSALRIGAIHIYMHYVSCIMLTLVQR